MNDDAFNDMLRRYVNLYRSTHPELQEFIAEQLHTLNLPEELMMSEEAIDPTAVGAQIHEGVLAVPDLHEPGSLSAYNHNSIWSFITPTTSASPPPVTTIPTDWARFDQTIEAIDSGAAGMRIDVSEYEQLKISAQRLAEEAKVVAADQLSEEAAQKYIWIMCSAFMVSPKTPEVEAIPLKGQTKNSINQEFYKMKEKETKAQLGLTAPQAKNLLEFGFGNLVPESAAREQRLYDQKLQSYSEYNRTAQQYLKEATDLAVKIRQINLTGIDIRPMIESVLKDGFYTISSVQKNKIKFTTAPVTCVDTRPKAGVSRSCYMGEYEVEWQPQNAVILVHSFTNNIVIDGVNHPHLLTDGQLCWGNASSLLKGLPAFNIKPIMDAIQVILTTYNADSPYQELDSFIKRRNRNPGDSIYENQNCDAWLTEDGFNGSYRQRHLANILNTDDDDGNVAFRVATFIDSEEETSEFDDDRAVYVELIDGRFVDIEDVSNDWEYV